MTTPRTEEIHRWSVEGHPLDIEYPASVMEAIRQAAVDGYYRIARGGVEVGGLLFGTRKGNTLRIEALRPLPCEHATGPSFVLSENDQAGLRRMLEGAASDDELKGLEPLGWYHSHTRSPIRLSQEDLEIYNRYFPEPWQVSLVLRPERLKPTRAGFFFREPGGGVSADSSYHKIELHPMGRKERDRPPRAAGEPQLEAPTPSPLPGPLPAPANAPSRRWVEWLLLSLALCLVLAGVGLLVHSHMAQSPRGLSLSVLDFAGQLEIRWDPLAAALRQPESVTLEILEDDGHTVRLELDEVQVRNGSVTYQRRSGTVHVRMEVRRADGGTEEAATQFLGQPVELPQLPPSP